MNNTNTNDDPNKFCSWCGDDVEPRRWGLGYHTCMNCGEIDSQVERKSWCITQPYGKGGYQLIHPDSIKETLHNTNQKQPRGI